MWIEDICLSVRIHQSCKKEKKRKKTENSRQTSWSIGFFSPIPTITEKTRALRDPGHPYGA